jgi:hypothetical protein
MLKTPHLPKQEYDNLIYNSPHAFEKGCVATLCLHYLTSGLERYKANLAC